MDESGDLGSDPNRKNSKYFVITLLYTKDRKQIESVVKKVNAGLRRHVKKLSGGVLHAYKEKPVTRRRLLKLLSRKDCQVMTIYLNKEKVYKRLQDEKHVLYNYVANILLDRIIAKKLIGRATEIILVAAKRETNKFLNRNFKDYLQKQVKDNHKLLIKIEIKTPSEEQSLQGVDFVSWAVFRKYEYSDASYYSLLKGIIIEESKLFS